MTDPIFRPSFDLGQFRHAAARYVKLLIRARWKCDPGFIARDDLARWELQNIDEDRQESWQLVQLADDALDRLNSEFLPRCGSGGVEPTDGETPEGRLIYDLAFLNWKGVLSLPDAAEALRKGEPVDWDSLVYWEDLNAIRDDLDELPHPPVHEEKNPQGRPPDEGVAKRREIVLERHKEGKSHGSITTELMKLRQEGELPTDLLISVDIVKKDIERGAKS